MVGVVCGGVAGWTPRAQASASADQTEMDVRHTEAFQRGVQAFRRGQLSEASSAFQEAWLIQPVDPTLTSWLSLVRDAQERRTVMARSVEDYTRRPPPDRDEQIPEPDSQETEESLEQRLTVTDHAPFGLSRVVSPVEGGRPEILVEGKRSGFQRLYKEGIGIQPIRGLGFSGRTEMFQQPNPTEALVLDAKVLNFSEISQYRRSILPLSTRSAAGRMVVDYEPWPRLTYEYDARQTLHQFQTRFALKDIDLQTHAFQALYSFPTAPFFGTLTVNPWYKRVLQSSDHDLGAYENRDEMIMNFSLQQTETVEYFFQFDGFQADKTRTLGGSKLRLYKGQLRLRFPRLRLFVIPSFEYSDTDFDPSDDEFTKRDMFVDWGIDLTKRLRASSKEQLIFTELSQPDHIPSNPDTQVFNTLNTLSYELFRDFDLSFGLDYSKAAGINSFDNVGLRAEVQFFKPGLIRTTFGYEWVSYYNISNDLSLIYWKFFLFQ